MTSSDSRTGERPGGGIRTKLYRLYYRLKYAPFAAERRRRRAEDAEDEAAEAPEADTPREPEDSGEPEDAGGPEDVGDPDDARRGFVAIQIDALAYEDLQRALELGYMPNLQRLIERDGWNLRSYPAGLPSATPAVQAAIFYGTKDRIPAFRFYDKEERRVIIGSQPAAMQFVRSRLPDDGILAGGSSYVNLYDGGADRASFTLSSRSAQPLFQKMGGLRLLMLLALHPIRVLRMVLASAWEYLREEKDRLMSQVRGRYTYYWWYLPLLHIGTNVVLRELQTLAVMLDIYTGVPAIYTTYNAYDEFAHHFGPSSKAALKCLRPLDRRIGEIRKMLRRLPGRPYDLYILSDHGQTPAVPYRLEYGETLGDTVIDALQHGALVLAATGDYGPPTESIEFLVRELEEVASTSSRPTRRLGLRLGRWLRRHYGLFPLVAETVRVADDNRVVVTYSSSLAHVYWTEPARPLTFDEIRADSEQRDLYYFLVAHDGIGLVITRMVDGAHVEGRDGRALVTPAGDVEILEGDDPLRDYTSTAVDRRAIARLAAMPNAGDLILFGAYDPRRDVCVCFDDQVGAHGALGGGQSHAFLLTPDGVVPPDHAIDDPLDLHPLFRRYGRYRGPRPTGTPAEPVAAGEATEATDAARSTQPGGPGDPHDLGRNRDTD